MRIHLIRHGMTVANEQKLYCGATDLPLSETGIADLIRLRDQGIYPNHTDGSLFFTSGLLRTDHTLDLLYSPEHRHVLPQLAEFNFGSFEMQSYEMLKNHSDYQAWITDETGEVGCPGGDSKQNFMSRVLKGYEILTGNQTPDTDIFAVCHGGVIACIMEYLCPNSRNFYEWQPNPGRGYTLVYISGKLDRYETI